jgi:hypothetical protein
MFSTFQKENRIDTTLSYVESDLDVFNTYKETEQQQMVKDIYLCYGGAGSVFAGKPTSFCNFPENSFNRSSENSFSSSLRPDEKMDYNNNFPTNSYGRSPENSFSSALRSDEKMKLDIKQIYIGSLTIVGLYILFRILQRG